MADVWEKDLAQKTSLATSDFIRVVGSDNVSYKQSVASVANATGSVYLGAFSASSDEDAVKSALTALKNAYGYEASSTTNLPKTVAFMRSGAWGFVGVAWIRSTTVEMTAVRYTDGATYFGKDVSGTQTVTLMPTRAEVDALTNRFVQLGWGTTISFTCATNHRFMMLAGNTTIYMGVNFSDTVTFNKVAGSDSLTFTTSRSGTTITITASANTNISVLVF